MLSLLLCGRQLLKTTYLIILDNQQNSKFYAKIEIRWKRVCQFFGDSYGHLDFTLHLKITKSRKKKGLLVKSKSKIMIPPIYISDIDTRLSFKPFHGLEPKNIFRIASSPHSILWQSKNEKSDSELLTIYMGTIFKNFGTWRNILCSDLKIHYI